MLQLNMAETWVAALGARSELLVVSISDGTVEECGCTHRVLPVVAGGR